MLSKILSDESDLLPIVYPSNSSFPYIRIDEAGVTLYEPIYSQFRSKAVAVEGILSSIEGLLPQINGWHPFDTLNSTFGPLMIEPKNGEITLTWKFTALLLVAIPWAVHKIHRGRVIERGGENPSAVGAVSGKRKVERNIGKKDNTG